MTPLAVITNRGSTRNLRGDAWVEPLLAGEPYVLHVVIERGDQVEDAVSRCAAAGAEVIAVNGGDGTADLVFGALLNGSAYANLPALALLPAGKTNMTTAGWSLTGTPEAAMSRLLAARRAGTLAAHIAPRPVLVLTRAPGTPPLYGAFFGAAEVVDGIRFCRQRIYPLKLPNVVSHATAMAVLLWRGLFASKGSGTVEVESEHAREEGEFFVVAVTALDELLLGLKPAPAQSGGALHYLSVRKGAALLGALPDFIARRLTAGAGRTVARVASVTLRFTGAYTLDGELYEAHADQPLMLDASRSLNFVRLP